MKIGIVTQPLMGNFGGILQNYALQQTLLKLGHEPRTIDYFHRLKFKFYFRLVVKYLILFLSSDKARKFPSLIKHRPQGLANDFIKQYLLLTNKCSYYRKSIIRKYGFKAIIAGSDQIWRPSYNNSLPDMYLRFTKGTNINRIAYAASFGVDFKEYSELDIERCKNFACNLNAISVRERTGIDLFKDYFGLEANKVLDPTLLLTGQEYINKLGLRIQSCDLQLCAYILDLSATKQSLIDKAADILNLSQQIIILENDASFSPKDWIETFLNSRFVITDSFHGTVFSIIFHKPFIAIVNPDRGADRFLSLLKPLGLTNRLINLDYEEPFQQILNNTIDWMEIDKKIDILREESINFLNESLNNQY